MNCSYVAVVSRGEKGIHCWCPSILSVNPQLCGLLCGQCNGDSVPFEVKIEMSEDVRCKNRNKESLHLQEQLRLVQGKVAARELSQRNDNADFKVIVDVRLGADARVEDEAAEGRSGETTSHREDAPHT